MSVLWGVLGIVWKRDLSGMVKKYQRDELGDTAASSLFLFSMISVMICEKCFFFKSDCFYCCTHRKKERPWM